MAVHPLFAAYRYLFLAFIIVTLILGSVGRFAADPNLRMYDIVHHFTNWSWSIIQLPFYSILWLCETYHFMRWLASPSVYRRIANTYMIYIESFVIVMMYTMLIGDAAFIYIVVYTHTDAIAKLWTVDGILRIKIGDLIVGNEIFHTLPIIFVLIYTLLYQKRIRHAYALVIDHVTFIPSIGLFYAYLLFAAPMIPILIYFTIFDPMSVYGINAPLWEGFFVLFTSLALSVGPAVLFLRLPLEDKRYPYHG